MRDTLTESHGLILSNPYADAPRRSYAEALASLPDPVSRAHAELIRIQLELLRQGPHDESHFDLVASTVRLLIEHGPSIAGAPFQKLEEMADFEYPQFGFGPFFPQFRKLTRDVWSFDRGFLSAAQMSVQTFLAHASEIFARFPLTDLYLDGLWQRSEMRVPSDPERNNLYKSVYDLRDQIWGTEDLVAVLANCPFLNSLRKLRLWCHLIRDASVTRILASPYIKNVETLELSLGFQSAAIAEPLINVELPQLERLSLLWDDDQLDSGDFGDTGAQILARGGFPRLRSLTINRGKIGSKGFAALLASTFVPQLEEFAFCDPCEALDLEHLVGRSFSWKKLRLDQLDSRGLNILTGLSLPHLQELDIGFGKLSAQDMATLAAAPWAQNLVSLNVRHNPIGDSGVQVLANSPGLAHLQSLDFSGCDVTDTGLLALANSPFLTRLTRLNISNEYPKPGISVRGIEPLVNSPVTARLRSLSVYRFSSSGDQESILAIARAPNLQHLTCLYLFGLHISPETASVLVASPHLARVVRFYGGHNKEAIAILSQRWPDIGRSS